MPSAQHNFLLVLDGPHSRLLMSSLAVNGYDVFATFGEARDALVKYLREQRELYVKALHDAQQLTAFEAQTGRRLTAA